MSALGSRYELGSSLPPDENGGSLPGELWESGGLLGDGELFDGVDQPSALEEDAFYTEMRKRLSELEKRESVETATPPIATSLATRALALTEIMAFYSQDNKVKALDQQLTQPSRGRVWRDHGALAPSVVATERSKWGDMWLDYHAGVRSLAATEAMQASGADDVDVELARTSIQESLHEKFGGADWRSAVRRMQLVVQVGGAALVILGHDEKEPPKIADIIPRQVK